MGGHRFERQLATPRMRPELYNKMKEWAMERIAPLFAKLAVPTELPEKPDYGDFDFLVAGSINDTVPVLEQIEKALGAVRAVERGIDVILYFAVKAVGAGHHVQIDVKVCHDVEKFDWMLFRLQYGTASMLIGSMLNSLGLTLDDDGLHLRVKEMEASNWNGSMIYLTNDTSQVMDTLGYDSTKWGTFETVEEVYSWLETSWVFTAQHFFRRLQDPAFRQHLEDRCRLKGFVLEWLPERYPFEWIMSKRRRSSATKKEAAGVEDALNRFVAQERVLYTFPDARPIAETKRRTHMKQAAEAALREKITAAIPMSVFAPCPMGRAGAFDVLTRLTGFSLERGLYIKDQPEAKKFEFLWSERGVLESALLIRAADEETVAEIWRRQSLRIDEGRRKREAAQEAMKEAMEILEIGAKDPAK